MRLAALQTILNLIITGLARRHAKLRAAGKRRAVLGNPKIGDLINRQHLVQTVLHRQREFLRQIAAVERTVTLWLVAFS